MARIRIEIPEKLPFSTEIPIRITDLNYGGHLGNDAMLSLIHEARVRFYAHHGWKESDVDGCGTIMTDAAIVYKAEVFYGDVLRFEVGVADIQRIGCDIVYRATKVGSGELAAEAKTGIAFFDYATRKVQKVPAKFLALFGHTA
jgi:acyl-CoA thioester hydrolase